MSLLRRGTSGLGLALAVGGALFLVVAGRPVFGALPAGPLVPGALVLAGGALGAYALLRANPGAALAGAGLVLGGSLLVQVGLPSPLQWAASFAGALGLVLYLEPLLVADRARDLRERLADAGEAAAGADPDALAERTVALRLRQVRRTMLLAGGLVAAALVAGNVAQALLPEYLGASLELDSLYGSTLWTLLGLAVLVGVHAFRVRGSGADDA